jgi:sucrose phosphorylase
LRKLLDRIDLRREQAAFHPNATQFTLHMGDQVFAFWRQSVDRRSNVFCLNNVSGEEQRIPVASINLISTEDWLDLISGDVLEEKEGDIVLTPYQCIWLANRRKHLPY